MNHWLYWNKKIFGGFMFRKILTTIFGSATDFLEKKLERLLDSMSNLEPKRIEYVSYDELLSWYKSKDILEDDVAVLADWHKINLVSSALSEKISENDKCILLAIVDKEKGEIKECELLISDNFDKKIDEMLGGESLVILE